LIQTCGASLVYLDHGREVFACREVDLEILPNEFVGILGPSGSGKSSLLYLLSGLKIPTSGAVLYDGRDLSEMSDEERSRLRLREFGFLFQQAFLLGYLTALENVLLASSGEPSRLRASELLSVLGLGDKTHRFPHELSGGERQRVCVVRSLLGNPKVVFADEPTASLDHANGLHVVEMLNHHREGGALVMVTHDETMLEKADRVLRIAEGQLIYDKR
jgi:putative ABC transport system ATP-binding protein